MSDIVFRNMEMPDSCYNCPFRDGVYCFFSETDEEIKVSLDVVPVGRHEDCPLIELPPHGRLIDADSLKKTLSAVSGEQRQWFCAEVGQVIDEAPTVVEATE